MLYIYIKELLPVLIVIHSTYGKLYFHILNTVKPNHKVTSIKQSPVLRGHLFLVMS